MDDFSTGAATSTREAARSPIVGPMEFRTDEPFTTAQARAAGITSRQLAGAAFEQVLHGVHAVTPVRDRPLVRARAALLVHPLGAVASRATAARLLRAPLTFGPDEHVTVQDANDRRRRLGIRCHVEQIAARDVISMHGVRLTAPARLFVDLAGTLGLVDLVVLGDWLAHARFISCEQLRTFCERAHLPHADRARRAASYVRERVESPMESRLRMLLVLAGLPEPEINLEIRDDMGVLMMRLDLSYPGVKVAVEYDGRQHADSPRQWERDVDRRNDLTAAGWLLITVTSRGIFRTPQETVERVWQALQERRFKGLRRPRPAWKRHFPS